MVKSRLEKSWAKYNAEIPIYLLDLIQHRDVSNQVAQQFELVHHSPQLLLIQSGELVHSDSHISISAKSFAKHI